MIETTPSMGVFEQYRHKGIMLMRDTIATWDAMIAAGMRPYEASTGMITMQPYHFRKAFAGRPANKFVNRDCVVLSVWHGHVEISCLENEKQAKLDVVVEAPPER